MQLGSAPFLTARVSGDTIWIEMLYVPPALRRHGLGREIFNGWKKTVPPKIKKVNLVPINPIDGEITWGFWDELGFHSDGFDPTENELSGLVMSLTREELLAPKEVPPTASADVKD